jgi:hypothetical protein
MVSTRDDRYSATVRTSLKLSNDQIWREEMAAKRELALLAHCPSSDTINTKHKMVTTARNKPTPKHPHKHDDQGAAKNPRCNSPSRFPALLCRDEIDMDAARHILMPI